MRVRHEHERDGTMFHGIALRPDERDDGEPAEPSWRNRC
jgi:hypothetical protein